MVVHRRSDCILNPKRTGRDIVRIRPDLQFEGNIGKTQVRPTPHDISPATLPGAATGCAFPGLSADSMRLTGAVACLCIAGELLSREHPGALAKNM